jgi:hypothetical protein
MTAWTGQLGQHNSDRTTWQDSQYRIARAGLSEQDSWDWSAGICGSDRSAWTGRRFFDSGMAMSKSITSVPTHANHAKRLLLNVITYFQYSKYTESIYSAICLQNIGSK